MATKIPQAPRETNQVRKTDESPSITDTILFDILTPDINGCYMADPYKVDRVSIYYVGRSFNADNFGDYKDDFSTEKVRKTYETSLQDYCDNPTDATLQNYETAKAEYNWEKKRGVLAPITYFKEAEPIKVIGSEDFPAWLSTDLDNSLIDFIPYDEDDTRQYGHFQYQWRPTGGGTEVGADPSQQTVAAREGDYFIVWIWTPYPAGGSISSHAYFYLEGDTRLTTSIPSHFADPFKYETLLKRYLPSMFEYHMTTNDMTPEVLQEFHRAVAKGFTTLENMGNQIVDLLDPNTINEAYLTYLSNMFNLKLRTGDPTLWRRQIKTAVPMYKQKGTERGLREALAQAGIVLNRLSRLWQIQSPYTWQEHQDVESDYQTEFELTHLAILPIDVNNFEVYSRKAGEDWRYLDDSYVSIANADGVSTLTWLGQAHSLGPIALLEGDSIRILYQIAEIPDGSAQALETYIRELPLGDNKDEQGQTCPLKNWNTRLMDEDDPLFNVLIPSRHPFQNPLMFGWIRTEFPYSENIYNMEEYNGSKRESNNPCDIDCDFIDDCQYCQSSQFAVDLEIEHLSNDRVVEALEIMDKYKPFHAMINTIAFNGSIIEYMAPPLEEIDILVRVDFQEVCIAGEGQFTFNRTMWGQKPASGTEWPSLPPPGGSLITRGDLASQDATRSAPVGLGSDLTGTAYNNEIVLFSPDHDLNDLGIGSTEQPNVLEVFGPSDFAGTYSIGDQENHYAVVYGVVEADLQANTPVTEDGDSTNDWQRLRVGLDPSAFTFRLSQNIYEFVNTSITQDDIYILSDDDVDFTRLGFETQWDGRTLENVVSSLSMETQWDEGDTWEVVIGSERYEIMNAPPDGTLILDNSAATLTLGAATYHIEDNIVSQGHDVIVLLDEYEKTVSPHGVISVIRRARVEVTDSQIDDVRGLINLGDYLYYRDAVGPTRQWVVTGFVEGETHQFFISNYDDGAGDVAGAVTNIYRRSVDQSTGQFMYRGSRLVTAVDHEVGLDIQNGTNPPAIPVEDNLYKENFLIKITGTTDSYYQMAEIDGTTITLSGPSQDWGVASGTSVGYQIINYVKTPFTIPETDKPPLEGHEFLYYDRRGQELITADIEMAVPLFALENPEEPSSEFMSATLNPNQMADTVGQVENISFQIEYRGEE